MLAKRRVATLLCAPHSPIWSVIFPSILLICPPVPDTHSPKVDVPGGYFSKYFAVQPALAPQISNCAIVGATPKIEATGEPALTVAYDNAPGTDGKPKGLFICQQAMVFVPQLHRP